MIEDMIQQKLRLVFNDKDIIFNKSRFAGGLTNYNYIMEIHGIEYVIRQPGGMTNLMIDRKIEKINNTIALEIGLNSECIYFDEFSGIKISKFIQNSRNIAQTDPCDPLSLLAVSGLMKKLHSSTKCFSNVFSWQEELIKYEEIVKEQKGDFFYDYTQQKTDLIDLFKKDIVKTELVPCHNDTVPENFILDEKGKGYLIDWEYSGMNDKSWDVAAFILESRLTEGAIGCLLLNYYGKAPGPEEILRMKYYILAQDLLWTVWALIRHYNGEDFLDYCYLRYERFRKNIKAIKDHSEYPLADMVKNE
jgi:Predicted choline kinase involved in LPS biosynthesis